MPRRPLTAIHEIRFGPRLTIDRARRDDRNRYAALRRIAGAGIHNMGVGFSLRPEELFIAAGSGHRSVLQKYFGGSFVGVVGIADLDPPAFRLVGRRAHSIDAASGAGDEGDRGAVPPQNVDHAVHGVALTDAAGV